MYKNEGGKKVANLNNVTILIYFRQNLKYKLQIYLKDYIKFIKISL